MSDPSLAIQKAVYDAIKGDSPAIAGGRIYDAVPATATFPYVSFGDVQVIEDGADCIDATEVFFTLDVWSRPGSTMPGQTEAKQIGAQLRDLLNENQISLPGGSYRTVDLLHQDSNYIRDPDGLSVHGIIRFRALVDRV